MKNVSIFAGHWKVKFGQRPVFLDGGIRLAAVLHRLTLRGMTRLFDLSGEIAVVIGGTGVLGGALVEGLAGAGALVAILGRAADRGEACAARIRDAGGSAAFFVADATDAGSLAEAHLAIQGGFGSPTVLGGETIPR